MKCVESAVKFPSFYEYALVVVVEVVFVVVCLFILLVLCCWCFLVCGFFLGGCIAWTHYDP